MSKIWAGLPQPNQTLAHTYGISFPKDMDVREKALMLAALFTVVSLKLRPSDVLIPKIKFNTKMTL